MRTLYTLTIAALATVWCWAMFQLYSYLAAQIAAAVLMGG